MNFQPLAPYYPKLSALGEHCEDLIRDRHYRESVQGMRQFAEGVLKTVFRVQDDDEGLGALMRRDDFAIVVPPERSPEAFRSCSATATRPRTFR